jgi:hypothetical protein
LGRHPVSANGLYALADVLLVHLKDDLLFEITVPHKIFSLHGCWQMILCAVNARRRGAGVAAAVSAALAETVLTLQNVTCAAAWHGALWLAGCSNRLCREFCINQLERVLCAAKPGRSKAKPAYRRTGMRLFDQMSAIPALVLFSPVLAVLIVFVRVKLGAPSFH